MNAKILYAATVALALASSLAVAQEVPAPDPRRGQQGLGRRPPPTARCARTTTTSMIDDAKGTVDAHAVPRSSPSCGVPRDPALIGPLRRTAPTTRAAWRTCASRRSPGSRSRPRSSPRAATGPCAAPTMTTRSCRSLAARPPARRPRSWRERPASVPEPEPSGSGKAAFGRLFFVGCEVAHGRRPPPAGTSSVPSDNRGMASLHSNTVVAHTGTSKGRGVFATRDHAAGEIVESCPVILFNATFVEIPIEVRRILFNWGVLANTRQSHCLALGYGSLYNHGNPANMRYEGDGSTTAEGPALHRHPGDRGRRGAHGQLQRGGRRARNPRRTTGSRRWARRAITTGRPRHDHTAADPPRRCARRSPRDAARPSPSCCRPCSPQAAWRRAAGSAARRWRGARRAACASASARAGRAGLVQGLLQEFSLSARRKAWR